VEEIKYSYPCYLAWAYLDCVCRWPGRQDILALERRTLGRTEPSEAEDGSRESTPAVVGEIGSTDCRHGDYR